MLTAVRRRQQNRQNIIFAKRLYCQKTESKQNLHHPTNQALPFENQSYKNNPAVPKIKASHNSSSIGLAADIF